MEQYVLQNTLARLTTYAHIRSKEIESYGHDKKQRIGMGLLQRTTNDPPRHDYQPPQVLPLDETNRMVILRIRYLGAGYSGHSRIYDRCEWLHWVERACERLLTYGQGKWEFRGKRRGDMLSEY